MNLTTAHLETRKLILSYPIPRFRDTQHGWYQVADTACGNRHKCHTPPFHLPKQANTLTESPRKTLQPPIMVASQQCKVGITCKVFAYLWRTMIKSEPQPIAIFSHHSSPSHFQATTAYYCLCSHLWGLVWTSLHIWTYCAHWVTTIGTTGTFETQCDLDVLKLLVLHD